MNKPIISRVRFPWHFKIIMMLCFAHILILFGATCNFLVIKDNGGKMPARNVTVDIEKMADYFSYETPDNVSKEFFADRYGWSYNTWQYRYSLGDVLMWIGMIIYVSTLLSYIILRRKYQEHDI